MPELTVAENIALSFNTIGQRRPTDLQKSLERYGLPFSQAQTISSLGPGARQLLEVARAMLHDPKVLLLDEPTAALDMRLAAHLAELIKRARDDGVGDRLRQPPAGRGAHPRRPAHRASGRGDPGHAQRRGLGCGRDRRADGWRADRARVPARAPAPQPGRLASRSPTLRAQVSAPYRSPCGAGEIVGVAGAEGNGQRALLRGLIGIGTAPQETVRLDGQELRRVTPRSALEAGISFQSGDRMAESIYAPPLGHGQRHRSGRAQPAVLLGLALRARLKAMFARASKQLGIVSASPYQPIGALSGGNQQKASWRGRPCVDPRSSSSTSQPRVSTPARAWTSTESSSIRGRRARSSGELVGLRRKLAGLCDRIYVMSRGQVVR